MLEILYYILGIFTGIILAILAGIVAIRRPTILDTLSNKLPHQKGYLAGSEFDGERLDEDKEIKIK